jgi:hypothetical protein
MAFMSSQDHGATLILGLRGEELQPIVERITGEVVVSFGVRIQDHMAGPHGIRGDKRVPTFVYATASGSTSQRRAFVKRQGASLPCHREAHHYRYLMAAGAAVVSMYGAAMDSEGRETLVLEHVDAVRDPQPCSEFLRDPDRFPAFLATIAHFNAVRPTSYYTSAIRQDMAHRPGPPGWDWTLRLSEACSNLERIWNAALDGRLIGRIRASSSKHYSKTISPQFLGAS